MKVSHMKLAGDVTMMKKLHRFWQGNDVPCPSNVVVMTPGEPTFGPAFHHQILKRVGSVKSLTTLSSVPRSCGTKLSTTSSLSCRSDDEEHSISNTVLRLCRHYHTGQRFEDFLTETVSWWRIEGDSLGSRGRQVAARMSEQT